MTDALTKYLNLAAPRIGARVVDVSDDFFAEAPRMLSEKPPVFIEDKYDDHGKWMDGWESRRKRTLEHDWCIVKLGVPGVLKACEIDTSHFTGNFPPGASLEACFEETDPSDTTKWYEVLPYTDLEGNAKKALTIENEKTFSHVRLNIFPDGGIARLRIFGAPAIDWYKIRTSEDLVNLAALELGARAIAWTDAHYGDPNKVLSPGQGANMGDGWETRRRREPGNDWLVVRLAHRGTIERVEIDTAFFKGNYPDKASIEFIDTPALSTEEAASEETDWKSLLPQKKLEADMAHVFDQIEFTSTEPATHIRLSIYPDGGVSRLRLFGKAL